MQDQASLAPQSTRHCCLEKGLLQGSRVSGSGHGTSLCSLLPLGPRVWPSFADRCLHAPEVPFPRSRQLRLLSALLSQACAMPGPGCQQMPVGRLQPRPQLPIAPHSVFTWQAACGTGVAVPPPPPATTREERLPVVTNPAESGRRLRCSQSPREIVPRASPQPRGTGTRASLLGLLQPPWLGPTPQGLWQCLGGMESTPWTWPCADPLAKGCPAAPEGCARRSQCSPAGRQAWHPWVWLRRGDL